MANVIRLSPSTLGLFQECQRCFWLQVNEGISRPRGAFPSLPGGLDGVLKEYFDGFRRRGILPPEIEGKVEGRLFSDERTLARWRNSQVGARYFDQELGALLYGALDDCLVDGDYLIPVDYKTRGYALKKESSSYYQHQLDIYCFLLKKEGYKVRDYAYLVYYIPTKAAENGVIHFHVQLEKADTDPCRGYELFCSAVKVLKGPEPEPEKNCEYCNWGSKAFARRRAQSDNAVMGGEEVRASAVQDRLF